MEDKVDKKEALKMDRLISLQAAIDEIDEWIKAFRENGHKESAADACLIQDGIIQLPSAQPEPCEDAVSRQQVLEEFAELFMICNETLPNENGHRYVVEKELLITQKHIEKLPSAQPTLHGYNIEHLELIAIVLQKEDLPPERVVEALTDIGRIVAIVRDEFEETLRRAVQNMERRTDDLQ